MPLKILKPNMQVTPNMQVSGDVTAELNYIKPDTAITPEVVYSGGDAPQIYNEAYAFMEAPIFDGRANGFVTLTDLAVIFTQWYSQAQTGAVTEFHSA